MISSLETVVEDCARLYRRDQRTASDPEEPPATRGARAHKEQRSPQNYNNFT
jgi:hypothetical protein